MANACEILMTGMGRAFYVAVAFQKIATEAEKLLFHF
jgi:hypothetical protein